MSDLYWLTDEQMARLSPYFPKSQGRPRVDDRRVLSGIIFVNRNGLRWRDAPREYGPHKTLYNRWKRWGEMGVFARMMEGLSAQRGRTPNHHDRRDLSQGTPHGFQPWGKKGDLGRLIGRTKGGMNAKHPTVAAANGCPLGFFITAARSAITPAQRPCSKTCQRQSGRLPKGATTLNGSGMRWRKKYQTLHSGPEIALDAGQIRQASIQRPQSHRDHVRSSQGLAPRRNPLRPLPNRLLLGPLWLPPRSSDRNQ